MNNSLIENNGTLLRILDINDTKAFVINCNKPSMPKWVNIDSLSCFSVCSECFPLPDISDMELSRRKCAYSRFTMISYVLPFITDKERRSSVISQIATDKGVSRQTICNYLWMYLVYQNISALAPKCKDNQKEL